MIICSQISYRVLNVNCIVEGVRRLRVLSVLLVNPGMLQLLIGLVDAVDEVADALFHKALSIVQVLEDARVLAVDITDALIPPFQFRAPLLVCARWHTTGNSVHISNLRIVQILDRRLLHFKDL